MKLQRRRNRKVGNKEYVKFYVDIPADTVKELSWKDGQNLAMSINRKKLVIEPDRKDSRNRS